VNQAKRDYSSLELMQEAIALRTQLVKLKTAIHLASEPIREKIFELSELKSFLLSISNMNCRNEIQKMQNYNGVQETIWESEITRLMLDKQIADLETKIEEIQDQIDLFNATTTI